MQFLLSAHYDIIVSNIIAPMTAAIIESAAHNLIVDMTCFITEAHAGTVIWDALCMCTRSVVILDAYYVL